MRLPFTVLEASVVLASAYSFWSTLYTDDHGIFGVDVFHTFSTLRRTRILECFFFLLLQNGEVCPVDASGSSLALHSSDLEPGSTLHELHVAGMRDEGSHFSGAPV